MYLYAIGCDNFFGFFYSNSTYYLVPIDNPSGQRGFGSEFSYARLSGEDNSVYDFSNSKVSTIDGCIDFFSFEKYKVKDCTAPFYYVAGSIDNIHVNHEATLLERGTDPNPDQNTTDGNTTTGNTTGDNTSTSIDYSSSGVFSWIAKGFELVIDTIKAILNPVQLLTNYLNPVSPDFIFTKLFDTVSGLFDIFDIDSSQVIFSSFFENVGNILKALNPTSDTFFLKKLFAWLNPTSDDFILKKLWEFLKDIISAIGNIAQAIGNVISGIFSPLWNFITTFLDLFNPTSDNFIFKIVFVPSQERIDAITNTVKAKFEFVDSIKTAVNSVKDLLNNLGNAPKITLNLKATKYTEEQNTVVFDLSWYAPYKAYGDLVITGFVYLMFIWRLLVTLPSIINGTGGSAITFEKIVSDTELHRSPFFDDRD